jgi:predicted nuclease of restriction endonuclease-like (RecB) superfamily
VIGCDLQSTHTGLESLLMMTNKPKKPEKVDTIVGQMKGIPSSTSEQLFSPALLKDIKQLIEGARARAAAAVNSEMVRLYWSIGERIRKDILAFERAAYGEQIVDALSRQLGGEYGRGFSRPNLFHMIRFAETFPDRKIVYALSRQLSWTHLRQIIYLDDPLQREFYAHMCRIERWSTRTLQEKIQGMLYERTAISRKPGHLAREELDALRDEDRVSPDLVFRDPYLLDFLGLKDTYSEKDLETAILRDLEQFLLELGSDFSFVARQKRITVDNEDYYLDLLFFHRRLRRLLAVELKLGRFRAADKGQMELYLRWLEKHECQPGEESPLGLILCAGKSAEHVELLQLKTSGIRVAEYLTELPPREVLERRLHQAIQAARERFKLALEGSEEPK